MNENVLTKLLSDNNTGNPLCIVENDHNSYKVTQQLSPDYVTSEMRHRSGMSHEVQKKRTNESGEVFTCQNLVNFPVNIFASSWFGRDNVFTTIGQDFNYTPTTGPIAIPSGKKWQDFLSIYVLEPTCGEAPHLVTRCDVHNHNKLIPLKDRSGFLDNKLRLLNEQENDRQKWFNYAKKAIQTTYGFDLQGDNVYFSRLNILQSLCDYYKDKFGSYAEFSQQELLQFAEILSYNIFQMDVFTGCVPHEPDCECVFVDWYRQTTIPFNYTKNFCNCNNLK